MPRSKKSLENLRPPWKKGDPSPNPGGRPKKRPVTDEHFEVTMSEISEVLRKKVNKKLGMNLLKKGITHAHAMALRQHVEAILFGVTQACKEIRESIEGKAPQRMEITGPERKEITIRIIRDRVKAPSSE